MSDRQDRRGRRRGFIDRYSKRPRVMLISGDPLQQALFFKECWQIGCQPVSAFTQDQAWKKINGRRCAIVIGGNRHVKEVAERIGKLPRHKVGKVVMFSGGMTEKESVLEVYRREPSFRYIHLIQKLLKRD